MGGRAGRARTGSPESFAGFCRLLTTIKPADPVGVVDYRISSRHCLKQGEVKLCCEIDDVKMS